MIRTLCRRRRMSPIGIDIGHSGVRAVQLARDGDEFYLHSATRAERAASPAAEPEPGDNDKQIAGMIRSCLSNADCRGRTAVTSLSPPDVEFHSLELPKAEPAELAAVIEFEVKRLFTHRSDLLETGHWMLPLSRGSAPNAIGAVAATDKVLRAVQACRCSGLMCLGVDTSATTLSRLGSILGAWTEEQIWGVLDVSSRQARLALCLTDVPVLVRTVGVGGDVWTERIAEALGTSARTAEVQKRDYGIALRGRGIRAEAPLPPTSELASVLLGILRSDLNDLAAEVKRSYEYVLSCYTGCRAADLILVGGGAALRNLPEYLSSALAIPVCRASEYLDRSSCRLRYASGRSGIFETVALAIGLALGRYAADGRN